MNSLIFELFLIIALFFLSLYATYVSSRSAQIDKALEDSGIIQGQFFKISEIKLILSVASASALAATISWKMGRIAEKIFHLKSINICFFFFLVVFIAMIFETVRNGEDRGKKEGGQKVKVHTSAN